MERRTKAFEEALTALLNALEKEPNLIERASFAKRLAVRCRGGQYEAGEQRSAALIALREEGWSLADLKEEFGISRARLSAMINREERRRA